MADLTRFKKSLEGIDPFQRLPDEIQQIIAEAAVLRHFEAGQIIYMQGEPGDSIYILIKGWVKATRMTREGREQAMMFLQPIDVFGDIAMFTGGVYPGTTVALEDATAWVIPAETILGLIPRFPDLAMPILRHLGERVLHYANLVEDLSLRGVEARLAHSLLQNAEFKEGQFFVPRRKWTTLDEMSVRLGTVRDVLSRALKTLEAENLLRVERQAIIILDPNGLAQRAHR